jgi:circadian clock protein KaiC
LKRSTASMQRMDRMVTGMVGLDTVLHGGFIQGGIYLIMGKSGTGKTVLGNQLCFNQVADGGQAVFLTLLAETSTQMLSHMQGMSFVDMTTVGKSLYYFSGYSALNAGGFGGLLRLVQQVLRDQRPTLLVIDGMAYAEALAGNEVDFKEFVQSLHAFAEAAGCTTFLLATPHTVGQLGMLGSIVDGIVELTDNPVGLRVVRRLQIVKFRGSNHLRGTHNYEITSNGIEVHPRTETILPQTSDSEAPPTRVAFGIGQLDDMLEGGLPSSSITMLLGVAGSGKTLLGVSFLSAGARMEEPGLHFGFYETPLRLIAKADRIGLDFSGHIASRQIEVMWQIPTEGILDELAERLLQAVRRQKVRRLFIDGIAGLKTATDEPARLTPFLIALTNELRAMHVTVLISAEMRNLFGPLIETPLEDVSSAADNMILLRYVELYSQLYRLVSIVKIRDSGYDTSIREFKISAHGIEVARTFDSAHAILTGTAQPGGPSVKPNRRSRKRAPS